MHTASIPTLISPTTGLSPVSRPCRPLTVLLAGRLTAFPDVNGIDSPWMGLSQALSASGVRARPWRPWEDSLAGVDCLHLFGTAAEHVAVAEAAKRHDVKVIVSPLAGAEAVDRTLPGGHLAQRATAWVGTVGRYMCSRFGSWRRQLYELADLLVPNSNAEARHLIRQFQIPADRIHIVHYAADPCFADADPQPFVRLFGSRDFVLHAGAIEPRNNQLGFLWAMRDVDSPIVMMGGASPSYEWYMAECRRVAGARVRFLPALEHDDPLLAGAYAACGCLVVPGTLERSILTALEAGMSGTPLVLPEGGCAEEYFGRQAMYARPDDVAGVRQAVLAALTRGRSKSLAGHVRTWFSWTAAAKVAREGYRKALGQRR